ncbi:MAG TPA: tetratricopeptide repeat protein [Polyangia bacterium]|nr:tetratricopeptide repeat protein [Polyangia bacterium]
MWVVRLLVRAGVVLAVCHGMAGAAPRRLAQAPDAAAKITQLNRDALAAIDKREFEKAREILKKALDLCESSGMAQHPVAARTHVHMGVVILEGFKNRELGEKQFAEALAIEPTIAMTPALVTPEITDAFDEARQQAKSGGAAPVAEPAATPAAPVEPRPAPAPRPAASSGGFTYHTVSEVKQGRAIKITVNVDESLKFHKVVLAYRPQGTSDFLGREMDPVGPGAYSAEIPDRATTGSSVAYYIEAQDDDGQPVANRGTEERPLVIQLDGEPSPEHGRSPAVAKHGDGESEDSTTIREEGEAGEGEAGRWFAGVLIGSGVGYASGTGETNANLPVSGAFAATSLGHVAPEVGYWVSSNLLVSAQGRIQVVSGPTEVIDPSSGKVYQPADLALALFGKVSWFFGSDDLRPFVSGGLGGGQIRHVVTFGSYKDCGATRTQTCVDSVVAGPALAEVGGGLLYKLSSSFGVQAGTNLEVAAPKFTFNVDLNAGVAVSF